MSTTTTREAGNLTIGDMIVLKGDVIAPIEQIDVTGLDTGTITTFMGVLSVRFTDLFTIVR